MNVVHCGRGLRGRIEALVVPVLVLGLGIFGTRAAEASSTLTVTAGNDLESIKVKFAALGSGPTTVDAGTLTGQINGGAKFDAYCVDLYHVVDVSGKGSSFVVDPLPIAQLGPPGGNGAGVGFLYDTLDPKIAAMSAGSAKDIDGAALQVAIWKVEYDNGGALTSGSFTMQDSSNKNSVQHQVFAQATAYLSLYDGSQSGDATWFKALEHPTMCNVSYNQDMVGPATCPPPVPTPEPATILTSGLGLIGLSAYGWRRRNPKAKAHPEENQG
jgi:PEP-CTERM motif